MGLLWHYKFKFYFFKWNKLLKFYNFIWPIIYPFKIFDRFKFKMLVIIYNIKRYIISQTVDSHFDIDFNAT